MKNSEYYDPQHEHDKALKVSDAIETETRVHNFSGLRWIVRQDVYAGEMSTPWMLARINPNSKRRFIRGVLRDVLQGRDNAYVKLVSPLTIDEKEQIAEWLEGGAR